MLRDFFRRWRARNEQLSEDSQTRRAALASEVDPFTLSFPLTGPWTLKAHRATPFATGTGPGLVLVLVSLYESPSGVVAVVMPTDFGHKLGDPMENFVESVAEQVRRLSPEASTLILLWPTDPQPIEERHGCHMSFEECLAEQTPIGPTTIIADPAMSAPTVLRKDNFTSRYRGAIYDHLDPEELRDQVGAFKSLDLSYDQIDHIVTTEVPDGAALRDEVLVHKEQALSDLRALLREHGLD